MTATAPVQDIDEARRMVGLEAPRFPGRDVPGLLPWHGVPRPVARPERVHIFYLAAEIVASAVTPTSLGITSAFESVAQSWSSFVRASRLSAINETGIGVPWLAARDVVIGSMHHTTGVTWELRPAARAVEGELSVEDLFAELARKLAEPRVPRRSKAFQAFTELRSWLKMSAAEAADLVGIGRTTPNAWSREGYEPRPSSARRLYQLHSIVRAVVRVLGEDEAARWLETGRPSPRELILSGDIEAVARSAERLLIGHEPLAGPAPGSLMEEPSEQVGLPAPSIRRRGVRKRRDPRS